jgi:hypothetical protein
LDELAGRKPENVWPGAGYWPQLALVVWATLAAAGLAATDRVFRAWPSAPPLWLMGMIAGILPLVDWTESVTNLSLAKRGTVAWKRALIDSIYWMRSLAVILFAFGIIGSPIYFWREGWHTPTFAEAHTTAWLLFKTSGAMTLCAAIGALLGNAFNRSLDPTKLFALLSAPLLVAVVSAGVVFAANGLGHVITAAFGGSQFFASAPVDTPEIRAAGLLLLLQLVYVCWTRALVWVGEPMRKANLGKIAALQKQRTPSGVKACLGRWCQMLGDHHDERASECGMTGIVRQALWRDAFGFIPVYSLLLLFGLWYGAKHLAWEQGWSPLTYLWFVVPLVVAVADYFENACHFHYLSLHEKAGSPNRGLPALAFATTLVKTVGFVAGLLAVTFAILHASWEIGKSPQLYGWRGLIGLSITTVTLLSVLSLWIWGRIYKFLNKQEAKKLMVAQG